MRFKGLFVMSVLLLSFKVMAQEAKLLEADFQMNGAMTMFWETEGPQDMSYADEGCRWHLEQKKDNDKRIVTFWIDMPDPKLKQLSKTTWKDAIVTMIIREGKKMYVVRDYQFRHLVIAEYDKGKYLVQLCSIVE